MCMPEYTARFSQYYHHKQQKVVGKRLTYFLPSSCEGRSPPSTILAEDAPSFQVGEFSDDLSLRRGWGSLLEENPDS